MSLIASVICTFVLSDDIMTSVQPFGAVSAMYKYYELLVDSMRFILAPDYSFDKLTDVSPEFLRDRGIRLLLLDLDNTISPYGVYRPGEDVLSWARDCREKGITLFIVSNNRSSERAEGFAKALGIRFINGAKKPSRRGIARAMELCGATAAETALAGDQIFTDVLAAGRSGIASVMVEPISLKNPLLAIRYFFELPFRKMSRNKNGK